MAKSSLGRRRGTRRNDSGRTYLLFGLVAALIVVALVLGILLGTHVGGTAAGGRGGGGGAVPVGVEALLRKNKAAEVKKQYEQRNAVKRPKHVNKEDDELEDNQSASTDDQTEETVPKGGKKAIRGAPTAKPLGRGSETGAKSYPYDLQPVPATMSFKNWLPKGGNRFAEYADGTSPYRITPELREKSDAQARSRRVHVKNAMKHAWSGYDKYAFGKDEVLPQTHGTSNNWGGMGTTLVDSLDTLWLMDMKEEFWKARDWVRDHLSHEHVGPVSVFETTIRSLGGLLSAYDWSGDKAFLEKAEDLGKRLFKAFDIPSGLAYSQVALNDGRKNNIGWTGGNAIIAEFGTLQLEFRYLGKAVNHKEYATKSEHVFEVLDSISPKNGLFPYFVRNRSNPPSFANNKLTFGAMADSLYEYMLKIWIQGGKTEPLYRKMYDKAMQGMHDELLMTSSPSGLTYIADKNNGVLDHKMDHLVCFMGGLLALGAYTDPEGLDSKRAQRDLKTAKALTYTCYQMYARFETGISPEFVQFVPGHDFDPGRGAPHYLLRPEAFESFFILHFLTKDPIYREWGWECFQAIERFCKTDIAYGSLKTVADVNRPPENKMESFFLAETLKYLYLLQDPDTEVDILNKHVFNTEAHPMRVFPVIDAAKQ